MSKRKGEAGGSEPR